MGDPIELQLVPPEGSPITRRGPSGGKATVVNVIRVPGLRKGRQITLIDHPSYPTWWTVAGMAPVQMPQHAAYHVGGIR